ncbi:hypothetical protein EV356DRAFT_515613 [Viridothelium virens]|uniref:Uncharacterized protein n=1 Tax=Viridothelium virens TaxID=1048519 RepID=A0A6A6H932_VIRVR|nr:hypothetical protein EV356DRAFT_515613 [Viridothelium virens]
MAENQEASAQWMRQALFRGVSLIQEALLNFRIHGFENKIQAITWNGFSTTIQGPPREESYIAHEFDRSLVSEPNDQSTVLTALYCMEAIAYTTELVNATLRGIATTVDELDCKLENTRREVKYYSVEDKSAAADFVHQVFRVILKSGEQYIIDLTGHQFGFHETVLPVSDYLSSRVRKLVGKNPVGSAKLKQVRLVKYFKPETTHELALPLDCHYALAMDRALLKWETVADQKLDRIIDLPEEQYLEKRTEFLEYLRVGLVNCREEMVERGLIRYTSDGTTLATDLS